jgi:tetratricopeptide (TPR) repeat protein
MPVRQVQEPERALKMYEDAKELSGSIPEIHSKTAAAYTAMHLYRQALSEHARASRLRPGDIGLRFAKIDLLLRVREADRAAADLDECAAQLQVRGCGSVLREPD